MTPTAGLCEHPHLLPDHRMTPHDKQLVCSLIEQTCTATCLSGCLVKQGYGNERQEEVMTCCGRWIVTKGIDDCSKGIERQGGFS